MKKLFLSGLIALGVLSSLSAQEYTNALGIRTGSLNSSFGGGVTYKHFTGGSTAIEGILSAHENQFMIVGLLELHEAFGDAPGLYWYYGGGGHFGAINTKTASSETNLALGVDGVIGVEYNLLASTEVPINFSLDWKPALNLAVDTGFWWDSFNLSIRYTW